MILDNIDTFEQLKERIHTLYDIEIDTAEISESGAGSLTYFVNAGSEKYVVKYPSNTEINNPQVEVRVCELLIERGLPVCRFVKNKSGSYLSTDENGRLFTVQRFFEGITYQYNRVPVQNQSASARMLARIHAAMSDIEDLPIGIGEDFLKYSSPKNTYQSYLDTRDRAEKIGREDILKGIRSNMRIISEMTEYHFDIKRFTVGNTHGDYMISQLIWDKDTIKGVIDFTCACKHPYIWEIMRSYFFMAPEVADGEVNISALINYISAYLEEGKLNSYDIENAGKFYLYFLAVCNFYGQYFASTANNREIYLEQAKMSSKLLVWFASNITELNNELSLLSEREKAKAKIKNFYNTEGKLISYPSKRPLRLLALGKIAEYFENGRDYTEKEVNEIIKENIVFSAVEMVRRELYDLRFMNRTKDGARYWREDNLPRS